MGSEVVYSDRKDRGRHTSGDRLNEKTRLRKAKRLVQGHIAPDTMEAGFELWPTGLQGKIQMAKQTECPSQVQRGLEGRNQIGNPGKFRACHVADLFSAPTLVKATWRIIELIEFSS